MNELQYSTIILLTLPKGYAEVNLQMLKKEGDKKKKLKLITILVQN